MHGITSLESGLRQAASIAGLARSFEAVNCYQLAGRSVGWALLMHQNLDVGLGAVKLFPDRKALFIERPGPEITGESQNMTVTE